MCQQRIREVLQFSERFLHSFVEIPPLDDFRDDILPSAAESSSRIIKEVYGQMKSNSESCTTPYHCRFVHLTCMTFPASPRRAESPTAAERPFRTFRTLFAYCGCVDAEYVQYTSRTCAVTGAPGQPTSRCVPSDEARAAQECAT
jgi:hypothetical protein